MIDISSLVQECAPGVEPTTMRAIVRTESGFNPYAIGVVDGHLKRQPHSLPEAVATARALEANGINFSVGLGQINRFNLERYGLTYQAAFDPCSNLRAGSAILSDCYTRAIEAKGEGPLAIRAAISCYYSGNFKTGLAADSRGTSYVERVAANAQPIDAATVVPAIPVIMNDKPGTAETGVSTQRPTASVAMRRTARESDSQHPSWDAFGEFGCDESSCREANRSDGAGN